MATFQRSILFASFLALAISSAVAVPDGAAQPERVIIVQDESPPGASPAANQAAYRLSIALDDALREAGFDVLPVMSVYRERLTPRIPQPEPPLAASLIVDSVERPVHLLVMAVVFDVAPASASAAQEQVDVRVSTRLLSYKGSLLGEAPIVPVAARLAVPRGCRDDCLAAALNEPVRSPLRQIAHAVRAAIQSR